MVFPGPPAHPLDPCKPHVRSPSSVWFFQNHPVHTFPRPAAVAAELGAFVFITLNPCSLGYIILDSAGLTTKQPRKRPSLSLSPQCP